jgi:putative DNA primase/helicase
MNIEPTQTSDVPVTLPLGLPGLKVMQKNCHFIRKTCLPERQPLMTDEICDAILSNAVSFDGGIEFAHQSTCGRENYAAPYIDGKLEQFQRQEFVVGCRRIQEIGFTGCPSGGCTLPSGQTAQSPSELWEWSDTGWNGIPDTIILQSFRERYFPGGLSYSQENYRGYQKGAFEKIDEQSGIHKKLIAHLGQYATASRLSSLSKLLQSSVSETPQVIASNRDYVCLNNGSLNITTLEVEPHSPMRNLQHRLNYEWDANATCPRFEEFVATIFAPDADRIAKAEFLQEWTGYLLVPDTSLQKMAWLVGGGGNGKSVYLGVIGKLLGEQYVSTAMLDRLDRPYVRAELTGKLANISYEIAAGAVIKDAFLKSIVAGDPIEAAYKRKPSFSFFPTARLMASTNNLPQPKDMTDGFNRRLIILPFNRQFKMEEQNPLLLEQLIAELPGILVWAIHGLRRLRQRGRFAIPPSSEQALDIFRTESNPVKQFAEECLAISSDNRGIPSTDLFRVFVSWCAERKLDCRNINLFGRAMHSLGYHKRKSGREFWLVKPNATNGPYFAQRKSMMAPSAMPVVDLPRAMLPMPASIVSTGTAVAMN